MANPITNLDPVLPPFRDGIQDQNDKLNALYEFFEQGPFNAVPTSGGTMTGPLHLQVPLEVASGGTGATSAPDALVALGAEPAITAGAATQYIAANKTLRTFFADVRSATLVGFSNLVSTAVLAADTVLVAIGKLQGQITALSTSLTTTITSVTAVQSRIGDSGGFTFRNRIINGACTITARPASTNPAGTTGYSGPDRFRVVNTAGTGLTISQTSSSITYAGIPRSGVRHTATVAATNFSAAALYSGISQLIEGINCYDLATKPMAISFIFNASMAGTFSISLESGDVLFSYVTSFTYTTANTPQLIQILVPAPPSSMVIPNTNGIGLRLYIAAQNTGDLRTSTLNAWQSGNYLTSVGQTLWSTTLNAFIELTELQLEAGTKRTEFEIVPYAIEMIRCQRYFKNRTYGTAVAVAMGQAYTTAISYAQIPFEAAFRSTPTVTFTGSLARLGGEVVGVSSFYYANSSVNFTVAPASTFTAGQAVYLAASGSFYLGLDAEF